MSLIAITREVSSGINRCELTHLSRKKIDFELARLQHRLYEDRLADLGCEVHRLRTEPHMPDSVFVEDTAVVVDELAIIANPGADSRKPETQSIAETLRPFRLLAYIDAPGRLDGGDVLVVGRTVYIGQSGRSNRAAFDQMRMLLGPHGYKVKAVRLGGCLHLKSAATLVGDGLLLINRQWLDATAFRDVALIDVDLSEPFAANALLVAGTVVYPSAYPATRRRLEERGIAVSVVDVGELAKAEGGVTCCSLIFQVWQRAAAPAADG